MAEKFVVYEDKVETAVLIAVCTQTQNREKTEEYLDELGIESIRNNIDTLIVNGLHEPKIGETTGYIKYKNGTTKFLKKEA